MDWHPVPGLDGAVWRPYLRKPDACCANAFLVAEPEAVLAIDVGADPAQAALLASEVEAQVRAEPRPALLILTHCHVDHAALAPRLQAVGAVVCGHALGADNLESGDRRLTAAFLFGDPPGPVSVDLRLFPDGPDRVVDGQGVRAVPFDAPLPALRLFANGAPVADVWHAPGHSPDGLVVGIGGLLFIGDLPFALDPVVATVPGFDPVALAGSVRRLRAMIADGPYATVVPGHGPPMSVGDAVAALDRMAARLEAGAAIEAMTPESLVATLVVAQELLEEADRVFSLIGGRLLALAHHLESLGESEAAAAIEEAFDDGIDACISSFSRFAEAHAAGEQIDIMLVLKAAQVTGKIGSALGKGGTARGADLALIGRFRRLTEDFLDLVATTPPAIRMADVDLAAVAAGAVADATTPAVSDDEVLAAAGDEAAFRDVLVMRLAAPPLYPEGAVSLAAAPGESQVRTDPDRLGDVIAALLEDLAGAGHERASVAVRTDDGTVRLEVEGDPAGPPPIGTRRREAYRRRLAALGADVAIGDEPFRCAAAFPAVGTGAAR